VAGNALSVIAGADLFDDLVRLLRTKEHGQARQMLAVALGTTRDRRAIQVLLDLLDDEDVVGHAVIGLGKLHPGPEVWDRVAPLLAHRKPWVRKEAAKLLKKIDRASTRVDA
jgi:HEAT repeat protein